METRAQSQGGYVQRQVNTILLTGCLAGIVWTLKSIDELKSLTAAQQVMVNNNTAVIQDMKNVSNAQSIIIGKMDIRLSRVETIQDQQKK